MHVKINSLFSFSVAAVVAAGMIATTSGCGSGGGGPTASLSGTVTIDGKPIPPDAEAYITFTPVAGEGGESVSVPITDGKYESPKTPQGKVGVSFSITKEGDPQISERTGEEYREMINLVPPEAAGGKRIEVTGDNPNQDFDL